MVENRRTLHFSVPPVALIAVHEAIDVQRSAGAARQSAVSCPGEYSMFHSIRLQHHFDRAASSLAPYLAPLPN